MGMSLARSNGAHTLTICMVPLIVAQHFSTRRPSASVDQTLQISLKLGEDSHFPKDL
jgi:hypothetical protein